MTPSATVNVYRRFGGAYCPVFKVSSGRLSVLDINRDLNVHQNYSEVLKSGQQYFVEFQ
jgi:hypothetical protein